MQTAAQHSVLLAWAPVCTESLKQEQAKFICPDLSELFVSVTPSPLVTGPRKAELQKASAAKRWQVPTPADTIPSPPQSVLGALIAVNLKNSLKQLADPFYLWKKSKLDCVSAWGWVGGTSLPDTGSSAHGGARQRPARFRAAAEPILPS